MNTDITVEETPAVDAPPQAKGIVIEGGVRQWLVPAPIKVLQVISGYLWVRWLVILAARHLFGLATECRIRLADGQLFLASTTRVLGKVVLQSNEVILARDVLAIGVERRYPYMTLLTGALGLLMGAIVGVGWVIDGIQASYVPIAVFGLGVLAAGVAFDIAFGSLADHLGSRTGLLLTMRTNKGFQLFATRFRIEGVDEVAAKRLLDALQQPS